MNTTETTRPFWRQGDIYFVKLDQGPDLKDAKPVKTGVIARGPAPVPRTACPGPTCPQGCG